jgi:hypothetical protein
MFSCSIGKIWLLLYRWYILLLLTTSIIRYSISCSLLLRRECCSFSNGEYVKAGLAELEQWCIYATEEVGVGDFFPDI